MANKRIDQFTTRPPEGLDKVPYSRDSDNKVFNTNTSELASGNNSFEDIFVNGTAYLKRIVAGHTGTHNVNGLFATANGANNIASGTAATIVNGASNEILSILYSTILNGSDNKVVGNYSTILGGLNNGVTGDVSVAYGNFSQVIHDGALVFSDDRFVVSQSSGDRTAVFDYENGVYMPRLFVGGVEITGLGINNHINDSGIHFEIDDEATGTTTVWSSEKINDEIQATAGGGSGDPQVWIKRITAGEHIRDGEYIDLNYNGELLAVTGLNAGNYLVDAEIEVRQDSGVHTQYLRILAENSPSQIAEVSGNWSEFRTQRLRITDIVSINNSDQGIKIQHRSDNIDATDITVKFPAILTVTKVNLQN